MGAMVRREFRRHAARLNIISHLLGSVDYKDLPRQKIKLPKRQKPGGYKDPNYPHKFVEQKY